MSFCSGAILRCNTKDTAALLEDEKFTALETMVDIIPNFTSDNPVDCIKGKFGPFRANSVVKVPLWLALEMDKLQRCRIELPSWLHEEQLKIMLHDEKQAPADTLTNIPEHYIEIAFAFLTESRSFNNDAREKSRSVLLLRELVERRRTKIIEGLKKIEAHPTEMKLTGMSAAEITCFRTRSLHAMDTFWNILALQKVQPSEVGVATTTGTQQDSSSQMPV